MFGDAVGTELAHRVPRGRAAAPRSRDPPRRRSPPAWRGRARSPPQGGRCWSTSGSKTEVPKDRSRCSAGAPGRSAGRRQRHGNSAREPRASSRGKPSAARHQLRAAGAPSRQVARARRGPATSPPAFPEEQAHHRRRLFARDRVTAEVDATQRVGERVARQHLLQHRLAQAEPAHEAAPQRLLVRALDVLGARRWLKRCAGSSTAANPATTARSSRGRVRQRRPQEQPVDVGHGCRPCARHAGGGGADVDRSAARSA